jgi:hypothetical protein
MTALKTYDVIVVTTDEWAGTVQATSRSAARKLAEAAFNDGELQQCGEEIERIKLKEIRP